jgi:nitrate reductase alpha subunit
MSHFLERLTYLSRPREPFADGFGELRGEDRTWEEGYRQRWQHDKIVRSTHGVNCTGSCSWKIYVKSGVVTWETQQTDYPRNRPGVPNTSREDARVGPPTAGISIARAASNTRWCAAAWSRRGAMRARP